jgi:hypothetical protein
MGYRLAFDNKPASLRRFRFEAFWSAVAERIGDTALQKNSPLIGARSGMLPPSQR